VLKITRYGPHRIYSLDEFSIRVLGGGALRWSSSDVLRALLTLSVAVGFKSRRFPSRFPLVIEFCVYANEGFAASQVGARHYPVFGRNRVMSGFESLRRKHFP